MRRARLQCRAALLAALALLPAAAQAAPFGTRPFESSEAKDMNAAGAMVIEARDQGGVGRALLYSKGETIEIGTFGGRESRVNAINSSGTAAGSAQTRSNAWRAYRFHPSTGLQALDTLGGNSSVATAINDSGAVAGYADTYDGTFHAFVDNGFGMLDLNTFGGKNSYATGINGKGMVVGAADLANGFRRAFLYKPGSGMIELPTQGGRHSVATAINEDGKVVGGMQMPNRRWHAFVWDGTRLVDLGLQLGAASTYATAINGRGDIIGTAYLSGSDQPKTFIYSNGHMEVRATQGGMPMTHRITEDGQIIGASYIGHVLQADAIARDQPKSLYGPTPTDYLTYALLALIATGLLYKIRQHLRDSMKFGLMMLSLA